MRINFFSPGSDQATGGVKVLYKHAQFLEEAGYDACIYHPQTRDFRGTLYRLQKHVGLDPSVLVHREQRFRCSWFDHQAKLRPNIPFDRDKDFLVIPEVWADSIGHQACKEGYQYVIYVQNGYFIYNPKSQISQKQLAVIYSQAIFNLSISEDTTEMIKLAFPQLLADKIRRVKPHVSGKFLPGKKENLITYMPRKLGDHADQINRLLTGKLTQNWQIEAIKNQDEDGVVEILNRSSIFLSFCHFEGCPLPPLEAALAGNIVVGYTGQGASEYFKAPLFREVNHGDFRVYIREILSSVKELETDNEILAENREKARLKLSNSYAETEERRCLLDAFHEQFHG